MQIDADPVPDIAYYFNADPDADPDPEFYLTQIRMRIQVTKMMWIHADPDPQHCFYPRASYLQTEVMLCVVYPRRRTNGWRWCSWRPKPGASPGSSSVQRNHRKCSSSALPASPSRFPGQAKQLLLFFYVYLILSSPYVSPSHSYNTFIRRFSPRLLSISSAQWEKPHYYQLLTGVYILVGNRYSPSPQLFRNWYCFPAKIVHHCWRQKIALVIAFRYYRHKNAS